MFLPLNEVLSTRRTAAEGSMPCLDIKYGDLMRQKITRLETEQVGDLPTLLGNIYAINFTLSLSSF